MATVITTFPQTYSNLDTYNRTIQTAGLHTARIEVYLPEGSSVSVVVKQNATTLATSAAPLSTQRSIVMLVPFNAALSDVISFAVTSSNPIDQQPNVLKISINLKLGPIQ